MNLSPKTVQTISQVIEIAQKWCNRQERQPLFSVTQTHIVSSENQKEISLIFCDLSAFAQIEHTAFLDKPGQSGVQKQSKLRTLSQRQILIEIGARISILSARHPAATVKILNIMRGL